VEPDSVAVAVVSATVVVGDRSGVFQCACRSRCPSGRVGRSTSRRRPVGRVAVCRIGVIADVNVVAGDKVLLVLQRLKDRNHFIVYARSVVERRIGVLGPAIGWSPQLSLIAGASIRIVVPLPIAARQTGRADVEAERLREILVRDLTNPVPLPANHFIDPRWIRRSANLG
jgi:hypothetical protein